MKTVSKSKPIIYVMLLAILPTVIAILIALAMSIDSAKLTSILFSKEDEVLAIRNLCIIVQSAIIVLAIDRVIKRINAKKEMHYHAPGIFAHVDQSIGVEVNRLEKVGDIFTDSGERYDFFTYETDLVDAIIVMRYYKKEKVMYRTNSNTL